MQQQENNKAYYVRYPVSNGTKDRWVSKSIFSQPTPNPGGDFVTKYTNFLNDARWKPGITYNGSQKPKLLPNLGNTGCAAYAADFVKYMFGKDTPRSGTHFTNPNEIRAGDILVFNRPHWVVVLGRNGNSLDTVEANWYQGKVERHNGTYTISGNNVLRDGKSIGKFIDGYHYQ